MKLIKFNAATAKGFQSRESVIRFNNSGVITLSKAFVDESGLKEGHKVSIVQDQEDPNSWFLVAHDPEGFVLRDANNRYLCFNNAYISKSLIQYMEVNAKSIAFKIATEATECDGDEELPKKCKLYGILTGTAKYREIEEEVEEEVIQD